MKEKKKLVLLLIPIPSKISIKEKLSEEMKVIVHFYDKKKLMKANDIHYNKNSKKCLFIQEMLKIIK